MTISTNMFSLSMKASDSDLDEAIDYLLEMKKSLISTPKLTNNKKFYDKILSNIDGSIIIYKNYKVFNYVKSLIHLYHSNKYFNYYILYNHKGDHYMVPLRKCDMKLSNGKQYYIPRHDYPFEEFYFFSSIEEAEEYMKNHYIDFSLPYYSYSNYMFYGHIVENLNSKDEKYDIHMENELRRVTLHDQSSLDKLKKNQISEARIIEEYQPNRILHYIAYDKELYDYLNSLTDIYHSFDKNKQYDNKI